MNLSFKRSDQNTTLKLTLELFMVICWCIVTIYQTTLTGTLKNQHPKSTHFKQELIVKLGRLVKEFKINIKSAN